MNSLCARTCIGLLLATTSIRAFAQSPSGKPAPVTADNFIRAESDRYFGAIALKECGFGKFFHNRDVTPIENQNVIRQYRDTLYSGAVFDLDAGPVTITLPDAGKRFMSMQVIDEDEYTPMVIYRPGSYTLTRKQIGTRYVLTAIRTLVDPADPKDVQQAHALQDAIKVSQPGGPGKFEVPNWDEASQKKVRDALIVLASTLPDTNRAFGAKGHGRPGASPDRSRVSLGGQSRKGRHVSQRHAEQE
jgi:hypothetical protein